MTYALRVTASARRQLTTRVPEAVATATWEFINGPLENPYRVGRRLGPPFEGRFSARRGSYRVVDQICDETVTVLVVTAQHRRDDYRT